MTVADYIFDFVQKKGCERVYMVSGSSAMWLTDALYRNEELEAVCCHHEQAAAMAADGYARVNHVPGACLVTIGPGVTNAITGIAQAYFDSTPVFAISGQANSRLLQYALDSGIRQNACQSMLVEPVVQSITKYCATIMRPEDTRRILEEAYYYATAGRPGPVWIDVPVDIQNRQVPEAMEGYEPTAEEMDAIDYASIARIILEAKKPLILAGFGVRSAGAAELLELLSNKYQIPVVTSRGGIDVIASDAPYYVGRPGGYGDRASHFAVQACDVLLILGSRLSVSTIGYYPERLAEHAVKIMVDIDEKELVRDAVPIQHKYRQDAKVFLERLLGQLEGETLEDHTQWIHFCMENKERYPVVKPEYRAQKPLNAYYFTEQLSVLAPADSNIVVDTGSVYCMVSQSWKLKRGQRYLASGGFSSMGSWATAIGACQAGRQVLALSGDGSTQMNIQEFATMAYHKLPVKLFVYNNNGYMLIRHNQHNYMNDRFLGVGPDSGLQTPDFCKVAQAYGLTAVRITAEDDLRQKLEEVLDMEGPVVCEVMVQEFAPIEPRIASRVMPDGSLKAAEFDDLYPFLE
ncbi:MAG: thiamine pyrophosphate-binding protein [Muribaculaceae bacterium]|nr:thiamine pyrophosphate-binding protein [Muribaculaceae bacterium]MCM1492895.1 thiamine pyrophosphate-binding protein [Muribaculaceae bacterium]